MGQSSWLVAGMVPGVERQPLKKLEPNADKLLKLMNRWRHEALQAGHAIERVVVAYEAGRDGLPDVRTRLNRLLGGWSAYFSYGSLSSAYQAVDDHVYDRVRSFLCKRHKEPGRGTKRFSREYVYAELGVLRLRRGRQMPPPCALR